MRIRNLLTALALMIAPIAAFGTVTGTAVSVSFTCSGSTGPYPFTFSASAATALTVTQAGIVLSPSVYTVTPVNNNYDNGGSVTLNTACSTGTLVISRTTPLTQNTAFTEYMPALYANFENGLDKLTEITQEKAAVIAPLDAPQNANVVLAGPSSGSAALPVFRALTPADIPITGPGCGIGPCISSSTSAPQSMAGPLMAPQLGAIYVADGQPGAGCAQKINAAITASSGNGTIQVGAGCGSTITTLVNPSGIPVAIQFVSAGTWVLSAPIVLGSGSSLSGLPSAAGVTPVTLIAANSYAGTCPADIAGTTFIAMICQGTESAVFNLTIDGNKAHQSGNMQDILVQNASGVSIHDSIIQNASQDDIHVTSTFYPTVTASESLSLNTVVFLYSNALAPFLYKVTTNGTGSGSYPSCSGTLNSTCNWGSVVFTNIGATYDNASGNGFLGPKLLLRFAGRDDFFTERNADWLIADLTEFELATRDGFHCEDCGAYRFSNDDWGANGRYGVYAAEVNGLCNTSAATEGNIIANSQFGGNTSGDIAVNGSASTTATFCGTPLASQYAGAFTISGNQFTGPSVAGAASSLSFTDAGKNNVIGNTFGWEAAYNYLMVSSFVNITGGNRQPNIFRANEFTPSSYAAGLPFSLTSGIDLADAPTQATLTEYFTRVMNGQLQINNAATGLTVKATSVFSPQTAATTAQSIVPSDDLSTTKAWYLTNHANNAFVGWVNDDGSASFPNVPQVGAPTINQAVCVKTAASAGPPAVPPVLGYCSTVVGAGGACTCN